MLHHIVWAFTNIEEAFYHSTCVQANSFILSGQPTQLSYVMHIKSTWLIDHCAKRPNWIPTKGRILLMQSKVTGLWRQPANKTIVNYLIWKAITGNTNGFNEQTRHLELGKETKNDKFLTRHTHTHRKWKREREDDWLVLPQWQTHVLLHLLQAVVVCVDEVKRQRSRQRAASSSWRDPQKPADRSDVLVVLNMMWRKY